MTNVKFPRVALRHLILPLLMLLPAWACGGASLPVPNTSDLKPTESKWPGTTLDQLSSGRRTYLQKCGTCHSIKSENAVPRDAWEATIERMRIKNGVHLSDEQAADIARYLYAMASR